jgi:hypothetical protein
LTLLNVSARGRFIPIILLTVRDAGTRRHGSDAFTGSARRGKMKLGDLCGVYGNMRVMSI